MEGLGPPELPERPEGAGRRSLPGFEPPAGRARQTVVAFYVFIGLAVANLAADVLGLVAVDAGLDERRDADSLLDLSDIVDVVVGTTWFLAFVVLVVLFLRWFHRVNRNLPALGTVHRLRRISPGWAVGSWFVPIANLFVPKMAANDVWRASGPDLPVRDPTWIDRPVAAIVHVWWGVWLVTSFADNVAARAWLGTPEELEEYRSVYTLDLVTTVGDIVAALLAIAVVRRLTARQEARAAALTSPSPPPVWREEKREFTREPAWAPSDSL